MPASTGAPVAGHTGQADPGGGDPARDAALAWAAHLREFRDSLCAALERGDVGLGTVLDRRGDPAVRPLHLLSVLEALPGARKVSTRRRLAALGLDGRTPIGDLSGDGARAVLEHFGPGGAGSAV